MNDAGDAEQHTRHPQDVAADALSGHQSTDAPNGKQEANNHAKTAKQFLSQYGARPIKTVVRWVDDHDGFVTALSTVIIAALTFFSRFMPTGN